MRRCAPKGGGRMYRNHWPDVNGMSGRMDWNSQLIHTGQEIKKSNECCVMKSGTQPKALFSFKNSSLSSFSDVKAILQAEARLSAACLR